MSLIPKLIFNASKLYYFVIRPVTLGVRLLMVNMQGVLLVKHTYEPSQWYLVGGGVKRSENLTEAARREAKEEVGAELGELKFLGIYTNYLNFKSDQVAVFLCNDFSISGNSNREIEKFEFFPLDSLPDNLASGHRRRIQEYVDNSDTRLVVGMW